METIVWVLLIRRSGYTIKDKINGFDYAGTFSTLELAQRIIREQEKPVHLQWKRHADRFEGEYWIANYNRGWGTNSQRAAIIIKTTVDYQIVEAT